MADLTGVRVVVVGLGPMGRGIARVFAAAGAQTTVVDLDPDATAAAADRLRQEAQADDRPVEVAAAADLAGALAGADLCVEAIVEDLPAKRRLLARLAELAPPGMVLASNTSSLSISELAVAFGDPARVVGMHFFNPPTRMRLVELVRGAGTSEATLALVRGWTRALGKTAVECGDSPNFVVNRICRPLYYEAQLLLTQAVEAAVVDTVARAALGHRMGPLELLDFVGLHTHVASSRTAHREFGDPRYRPIPIATGLVRAGHTGRAAGRGFYDYRTEKPAQARARVTRPAPEPATGTVRLAGPDAAAAHPRLRAVAADAAPVVLYRSPALAGPAQVAEVAALMAQGRQVVVDSSHGGWLDALPPGAGWLRLHFSGDRPFAEVVADPVAGIAPPPAVAAVLAALAADSVLVPALPGLVADRLAHCLVNEAVLVVEEGTADRAAVDLAMTLGMNHPVGPFGLLAQAGAAAVRDSLDGMLAGAGDPRYRPAWLLRRMAAGDQRGPAPGGAPTDPDRWSGSGR